MKFGNLTIVFLCTVFSLFACAKKDESILRLGYLQSDLHHLPAFVALENGYFAEQGLKVQVGGVFKAGPEEMSAFGAGELDFGYVGQAPATAALLNGVADIQFIAQVNLEGSAIVARKDAGSDLLIKLTAKTVAIPGHATMQDFLLRRALKNSRMNFSDIRPIVLKPPEMLQALVQKNIDAFIAWEPYPQQALQSGKAQIVLYSAAIWNEHPCCVLIARRMLCDQQPEAIKKIQAAHAKACSFITDHPDEAVAIGMKYSSMERSTVVESLRHIIYTGRLNRQMGREFVDFLKEQRYIKASDAEKHFSQAYFE
jgi:NitT/TauT family transport system substrate-binding protein